jgi:glycosyltransferase involved in cell wall biosynthesis
MPTNTIEKPTVSIISPVYNGEDRISELLESILNLDYPRELLEIIIVDNGSTDNTKEIVKKYPATLLEETEIQSSYAARNKGIQNSSSEIIAFVDSDCIVTPQWINEGVKHFHNNADLVGGKIEFYYSKRKSAAEMYDSITNMQNECNIRERNVAKTANLFARSSLFSSIGMFPKNEISGGDVYWTALATKNGYSLVYAPEAVVKHPARTLKDLLKKHYRVGQGMANARSMESKRSNKKSLFRLLFPRISDIKNLIEERGTADMNKKIFKIWIVAYICNITTVLGVIRKHLHNRGCNRC